MIRWSRTPAFLYFIQEESSGPIKIGIAMDVPKRLLQLQGANPRGLAVLVTIPAGHAGSGRYTGTAARETERAWHARFAHLRIRGEWFSPGADLLMAIDGLRQKAAG